MTMIDSRLSNWKATVENGLERYLPPAGERPANLHHAMRYSLEAGGKRLRPALLLAAFESFNGHGDPIPAAVAIECIHTYSLIHDDLPCIDNSDLRRGRPSCHVAYDEPTALLAGDALLTHAFEVLATAYAEQPALGLALVRDLAEASGSRRLIGGQMEDIEGERTPVDAATLDFIHRNKTGALITAAVVMGTRFAEDDQRLIPAIREIGYHAGMAFQIIDDILDATQTAEAMGKPTGSDAAAGKSTYVALHGIDGARREVARHTAAADTTLAALGAADSPLAELVRRMSARKS